MRPIMMRCACGFGKHYLWVEFIRCFRHQLERRREVSDD